MNEETRIRVWWDCQSGCQEGWCSETQVWGDGFWEIVGSDTHDDYAQDRGSDLAEDLRSLYPDATVEVE